MSGGQDERMRRWDGAMMKEPKPGGDKETTKKYRNEERDETKKAKSKIQKNNTNKRTNK